MLDAGYICMASSGIKYQVSSIKYQVSSIEYRVSSIQYPVSSIGEINVNIFWTQESIQEKIGI